LKTAINRYELEDKAIQDCKVTVLHKFDEFFYPGIRFTDVDFKGTDTFRVRFMEDK
jgi:hypothetical protein